MPTEHPVRIAFHNSRLRSVEMLDRLSNADLAILVSRRLGGVLLQYASEDLQALRTVIQCKDGMTADFLALDLAQLRACFDKEHSVPRTVPGLNFPVNYSKLVLRDNCVDGAKLARDADYTSLVLVERSIVEPLRALPFKGFAINEDYAYDGS